MATISTATASSPAQARIPRSIEKVYLEQEYHRSTSASNTEIIWFENLKIPHQAVITDLTLCHETSDGQTIWQVGIGGGITSGALFGSVTISDTSTIDTLLPKAGLASYRVSVSDDQPLRWVVITVTQDGAVGSSPTGSVSVTIRCEYSMIRS